MKIKLEKSRLFSSMCWGETGFLTLLHEQGRVLEKKYLCEVLSGFSKRINKEITA